MNRKTIARPVRYGMGEEYRDCACGRCGKFICSEIKIDEYRRKVKHCSECGNKFEWDEIDQVETVELKKIVPAGSFYANGNGMTGTNIIDYDTFNVDLKNTKTIVFKSKYDFIEFDSQDFIEILHYLKEFKSYFPLLLDVQKMKEMRDNAIDLQ